MFCENCGKRIADTSKFCAFCGTKVTSPNYADNIQQNAKNAAKNKQEILEPDEILEPGEIPSQPKINQQNSTFNAQPNIAQQMFQTNIPQKQHTMSRSKRIAITITSTIAAIAVIASGAIWYFITDHPINVPKAYAGEPISRVVKEIKKQGAQVKIIDEFSGKKAGTFLRYINTKSGDKISSHIPVVIAKSKGPGIPEKGVVGESLKKAEKLVKSMGLPVEVNRVISDDPGKIIASSPMPGYAVTKNDIIHLAVGTYGDGIPINLFGENKNKAYDKLVSRGYNVTLHPKFSSRRMLGKIVGSNPSLGSPVTKGEVTLYYGVDASQTKSVFTNKDEFGTNAKMDPQSVQGTWCTKLGDCVKFESYDSDRSRDPNYTDDLLLLSTDKHYSANTDENFYNSLDLCNATHDPTNCGASKDRPSENPMKNHLLFSNTGAVEIYRGHGAPYCGSERVDDSVAFACVNGKVIDEFELPESMKQYGNPEKIPGFAKGSSFKMSDFFVLVPVNTRFDDLIKSGYFAGKGEIKPDLDRPFILKRDPKLYKETEAKADNMEWSVQSNPFVPTVNHKPVPFAPAPDDRNVYYLMEEPFDWTTLPGDMLQ